MESNRFKISKESVEKIFPKTDIPILGYESPIEVFMKQMRMEQEDNIYKAVQEYGVSVDKDELVKALQYDRDQYDKGYINGYNAKASEVAREIIDTLKSAGIDEWRYPVIAELKKKYITEEGKWKLSE